MFEKVMTYDIRRKAKKVPSKAKQREVKEKMNKLHYAGEVII